MREQFSSMSNFDQDSGAGTLQELNDKLKRELLELRLFIDSMQNLMDAVETPGTELEIIDLLEQVLANALQTINAKDGSLLVVDEDTAELVFVITHGEVPKDDLNWQRLPPKTGIAGWVVENRRATIANDPYADDRFYAGVDRARNFKTDSVIAAPIIGGDEVLGVIEVLNKRDDRLFNNQDLTLLSLLCRFSGELLNSIVIRHSIAGVSAE